MTTLIGHGSHGSDIEAIWYRAHPNKHLYVTDDRRAGRGAVGLSRGARVRLLVGVNNSAERMLLREEFYRAEDAKPLVDPSAVVGPNVDLGDAVVIAPHVTLLHDVVLYRHVHVNYGAGLTRCSVGAFVTIGPGANIGGDVAIGVGSRIGAGATVCDRVVIGEHATIGAGAVVLPEARVPDGETWVGVPARRMGT